jgi:hypothetical protein
MRERLTRGIVPHCGTIGKSNKDDERCVHRASYETHFRKKKNAPTESGRSAKTETISDKYYC